MGAHASVRRNGRGVLERNALALAEQRKKNKRGESERLQNDGNGDRALLDAAGAFFGQRIAFDQATTE
jgi:hypothetical protein